MADISKITLPNGSSYDIKDATARSGLDGKAASKHTHDDRYYTESEIDTKLNGKANTSHGNHVPTTQTANNAVFLRNDNTWQTVTPANIGAAASSHTHSNYVNQNAFSNVVVGSTTVAADSATDTLTLVAGSNVTITPDATNDKITIAATQRPLGTTADTACAGNDSRLSNSRPASDVYAWAKASTKPSYSYNEITNKPSITPQAYGAKGDGSTNDTSAFTSMLNAISSNGGVVYIPNGTYILDSITVPDNVTLVGESLKAILKQSSTTAHMITLGNNCKIEGLSIDGNGAGRTGDYASVYISGKKNCVISNCVLYNGIKWNIYSYSSERVVIENCETYGCVTGAAITITGNNSGYCRINHCYSHNNKLDGFVIAQKFTIIENCYSYQNGTTSVGAAGIYCNDNADFSTINNNIIDSNYGIGIEVAGNSQNIIISKNRVTNNKTDGIEVRQNAQPIITENYLYNNTSAKFSGQISYSVDAGAYYAIINNNIIDCNSQTNYGIYAPNATDCLGTNIIVNAKTSPMNVSASSQLGTVKDNQYEYYKRKYIRFTDSRWLNVVNAGSASNIDIAGNQTFRFVSTDGGLQRVKMISNMPESAPSSPTSGDFYCDASGLHIYRNGTWKLIKYSS